MPGCYLFRLVADNGWAQWVPLTVRAPHPDATFLVVNSVTTWQAYNDWGGESLYVDALGLPGGHARQVSFDRPYADQSGSGELFYYEHFFLQWAEALGYDLTGTSLGDVRVALGYDLSGLLGTRDAEGNGLGLALRVQAWLPTGNTLQFHSEDGVRVLPAVVADWRHNRWLVGANVGWLVRKQQQVFQVITNDALRWGAFAQGPLVGAFDWLATVYGTMQTAEQQDPLNALVYSRNGNADPMEALGGVRWHEPEGGLDVTLAGGAGLNTAVGSPALRVVLQAGYNLPAAPKDRDGDGILDKDDKCPNEAEDKDGWQDDDGCPDPDNDGDKLLDPDDKCPDDPTNQCKAARVGSQIVIYDRVEFAVNKAELQPASDKILDAVVEILKGHPEVTKVEVQGHTDGAGKPEANMTLSQARAETVMKYLVDHGIEAARLTAKGYGQTVPLVPENTPEDRQKNRRVQFIIVE